MATSKSSPRSFELLMGALAVLLGGLLGSALARLAGALLGEGPIVSFLTRTWTIGLQPPSTLDLRVLSFTLGATLDVGLLTVVGAVLALWFFLRRT